MTVNWSGRAATGASPAREQAEDLAEARGDYYVMNGHGMSAPLSEEAAQENMDRLVAAGFTPVLLKVVQDYRK